MKVQLENREYWIEFAYETDPALESYCGEREVTSCLIRDGLAPKDEHQEQPIVARGQVVRYYKDTPNRDLARKAALAKALENLEDGAPIEASFLHMRLSLNKARRKLFWSAYLNRKKAGVVGKAGA